MHKRWVARVVKVVKSSKTAYINQEQSLAFFVVVVEGRRLLPDTMPYEQMHLSCLAQGKGEHTRTSS